MRPKLTPERFRYAEKAREGREMNWHMSKLGSCHKEKKTERWDHRRKVCLAKKAILPEMLQGHASERVYGLGGRVELNYYISFIGAGLDKYAHLGVGIRPPHCTWEREFDEKSCQNKRVEMPFGYFTSLSSRTWTAWRTSSRRSARGRSPRPRRRSC